MKMSKQLFQLLVLDLCYQGLVCCIYAYRVMSFFWKSCKISGHLELEVSLQISTYIVLWEQHLSIGAHIALLSLLLSHSNNH